jgi:hypothetical protein
VLETALSFRPTHFDVATGDVWLRGTIVELDPTTGRATGIRRVALDQAAADRLAALAATSALSAEGAPELPSLTDTRDCSVRDDD